MAKRLCPILLSAALMLFALTGVLTIRQQQGIAEKMIRLHVVAASDSETDQSNKLQVRDCVLEYASVYLSDAQNAQQARAALAPHLTELQEAAEACLLSLGVEQSVTVTLGSETLDTRDYDSFTLPAGRYTTLRVTIGAGEGHNWWCVVFPSLCTAATTEALEQDALQAGLTSGDVQWITSDSVDVTLRFKTLEWLQRLLSFLS